jgi:uncharacterized membrane protein YfcA
MVVLAVAAGLFIGLSLGALGGGGSILAVPVLVYLLGQSAHQATTASLLVVGIAAVAGAITHARAGRVRLREGMTFGVLGVAGAYLGSKASAAVPSNVLLAGFGVLMLAVAGAMLIRRARARTGRPAAATAAGAVTAIGQPAAGQPATAPRGASSTDPPDRHRHPMPVVAAATAVGLITGFFGVGGGFVVVPALVLILGFDMPAAAGTSLVVIAINSAVALASRAGHGGLTLNWAVTGTFAAAAVAGVLAGGRITGRVSPQRLAAAFTILIIVVAAYTIARSVPRLA